jgi:hypothetical protein
MRGSLFTLALIAVLRLCRLESALSRRRGIPARTPLHLVVAPAGSGPSRHVSRRSLPSRGASQGR